MAIEITVNKTTKEVSVNVVKGGVTQITFGSGVPSGDPGEGPKIYIDETTGYYWRWNGTGWELPGGGSGDMLSAVYDPIINANTAKKTDAGYVHDQPIAASVWNITHNLNKYPSITIVDTSGNIVEGEENFTDTNNVTISFSAAFAGKAYFN